MSIPLKLGYNYKLPQASSLSFLIVIQLKINQNLLWAASDQFPLMFNSNLIKINQYLLCDASDEFRKTINGHLMSPRKRLLGI